ncbi:hypothetical protein SARC_03313 [Sphaeroforma arctica JP610]|uniref:Uncharacterized protein n=1 Tax=Sphaeroforma arctica JP610 TaxID=667725 RepID=A0A0L0G625_9EUKA|nr:hypothetical protein SARC_03313 [Sphaeroforma arctica JP610]KNC84480.1 hypothetical protein SARC_03313 [Sphaeroforma arctica JP610]|eukprot:XP_014158382.1 hypothetical protein SARC_03313 [Sphaeroforma arctica JP610]
METILPLALDIVFYWYNFMPLTRGGAAVGFIALHAIVLAVGLEITASPPFQTQLDWEAILCPNPATYQERLLPWLRRVVKPVCRATSAVGMGHAHTPKHTPCDGHATHETPGWVACTGDTKRAGVGGARESRIGSTTPHSEGTAVYDTHSDRTVVCDTNSAQIGEVGEVTYNRSSTREAEGRGQDMHKNNPPICVGDGIHTCSLQHATEPTRARVRGGARRCTPMGGRLDTAVCAGSTGPAAGCTYAEGCEAECVFATGQSCGCGFSVSECTCASVRIPECGSSPRCTHGDVGIGSDKEGRGVVCMCRCAPEDVPMCECVVCAVAVSDRLPTPRAMVLALNADLERYIDIKVN